MAAEVILDIIENARWREIDGVVVEVSRLAIVRDIDLGSGERERLLSIALNTAGVPVPGSLHPIVPGLRLRDRVANPLGRTIAQIELRYYSAAVEDIPPFGFDSTVSGSIDIEQIETQLDKNGDQITVSHNDIIQGGSVLVTMPRRALSFTTVEQSSAPGALAEAYAGKVNSVTWQGGTPGTWICLGVPFEPVDRASNPPSWRYRFDFRHRVEGHDPTVIYIDPETGAPPPGLTAGVGIKTIEWYEEADFHELGI